MRIGRTHSRLSALILLGALVGCQRSDLTETHELSCGGGVRVVVASSPLCVYAPGVVVESCPEAVPERSADAEGWTYCAVEEDLPAVVLGAARTAAQQAQGEDEDLGPPDALRGQEGFGGGLGGSGGTGGAGGVGRPDTGVPRDLDVIDVDGGLLPPDAGELPDF